MRRPLIVLGAATAVILLTGSAYALGTINVIAPIFPVVGQADIKVCDSDGVTTSYTYGNSNAKGVRVTSATVSDIDSSCTTTTLEFVDSADNIVATYTGAVVDKATTVKTSIFTNEFDSVRVVLSP
jgi:hypothetical protein